MKTWLRQGVFSQSKRSDTCSHEIHDLLGAYVLNSVSLTERIDVERHIARCRASAGEVAQLQEVAGQLAADEVAQPDGALKQRALSQIRLTEQTSQATEMSDSSTRWWDNFDLYRWRRVAIASLAACAVILAAGSVTVAVQQNRLHEQRKQLTQQEAAINTDRLQITEVISAKDARVHTVNMPNGGTVAFIDSQQGDKAVAMLSKLPIPEQGHVYQMWLIAAEQIRSVGVLKENATDTTKLIKQFGNATVFGLTLEPVGGSKKPTMSPLVTVPIV